MRAGDSPIFDWNLRDRARARNLVGAIQIPGASIEIVPKLDPQTSNGVAPHAAANLIYMLSLANQLPIEEVGSASLLAQRIEMLEVFVRAFANDLLAEMEKGLHRDYSRREDELAHVKGQVALARESLRPPWARHRVSLRWDEYDENTVINRCIKAACQRLSLVVRDHETRSLLVRAIGELDFVSDVPPTNDELTRISFDRINRRFERVFLFARSILLGDAPSPRSGDLPTISLVFPMERLFEVFIARSIVNLAPNLGLQRKWVHPQGVGRRLWLLVDAATGRDALRLKPDLVIDRAGLPGSLIIDTKWKRLLAHAGGGLNVRDQGDIYQALAYAVRYAAQDSVLLFPGKAEYKRSAFSVPGWEPTIRIELIDLDRDLAKTQTETRNALHLAIWGRNA